MSLLRPDLVILQPLKAELAFDPLTQLFMMVGQLLRIPAFCRGEINSEHLELMTLPEPEQRPHPVITSFLLSRPFPGDWFRRNSFQRLIGHLPLEGWQV